MIVYFSLDVDNKTCVKPFWEPAGFKATFKSMQLVRIESKISTQFFESIKTLRDKDTGEFMIDKLERETRDLFINDPSMFKTLHQLAWMKLLSLHWLDEKRHIIESPYWFYRTIWEK